METNCIKCGALLKAGVEACHICRTPVDWEAVKREEEAKSKAEAANAKNEGNSKERLQKGKSSGKKLSKKKLAVFAAVIAIVVTASISLLIVYKNRDNDGYLALLENYTNAANRHKTGIEMYGVYDMNPYMEREQKLYEVSYKGDNYDTQIDHLRQSQRSLFTELAVYYGMDWKINYSVIETQKATKQEIEQANKEWHKEYPPERVIENTITLTAKENPVDEDECREAFEYLYECYKKDIKRMVHVTVEFTIDGSDDHDTYRSTYDFAEVGGQWVCIGTEYDYYPIECFISRRSSEYYLDID